MSAISGNSQQPTQSVYSDPNTQQPNRKIILNTLDYGCARFNDSSTINTDRALDVNRVVLESLEILSNDLAEQFSEAFKNVQPNSKIGVIPLKGTSILWKETGKNPGCVFALKTPQEAPKILDRIKEDLFNRKFKYQDGEFGINEMFKLAFLNQEGLPDTRLKPILSDIEKKIDNAFNKLLVPEMSALTNLSKIKSKLENQQETPEKIVNDVKERVIRRAFCEYMYQVAPLAWREFYKQV